MNHGSLYMPYLMVGYGTAFLLIVLICRACAWSVPVLRGMRLLSWSYMLAIVCTVSTMLRPIGEPWLTMVVANLAAFGCWFLVYCAAAEVVAARKRWLYPGLILIAAVAGVEWYIAYIRPSPDESARILLCNTMGVIWAAATADVLFRYREKSNITERSSLRPHVRIVAWQQVLLGVIQAAGFIPELLHPDQDFVNVSLMRAAMTHLSMVMNIAGACGLIWLAFGMHQRDLERLAQTDGLTGALNRRAFMDILSQEYRRGGAKASSFAVLLADIDHFKSINDAWGHAAGDMVICEAVRAMRNELRLGDVMARIGGEEFAVLLRRTDPAQAEKIAERLRSVVAARKGMPGNMQVTVSIGLAENLQDDSPTEILRRCDVALYRSKREGRNRVTEFSTLAEHARAATLQA